MHVSTEGDVAFIRVIFRLKYVLILYLGLVCSLLLLMVL